MARRGKTDRCGPAALYAHYSHFIDSPLSAATNPPQSAHLAALTRGGFFLNKVSALFV